MAIMFFCFIAIAKLFSSNFKMITAFLLSFKLLLNSIYAYNENKFKESSNNLVWASLVIAACELAFIKLPFNGDTAYRLSFWFILLISVLWTVLNIEQMIRRAWTVFWRFRQLLGESPWGRWSAQSCWEVCTLRSKRCHRFWRWGQVRCERGGFCVFSRICCIWAHSGDNRVWRWWFFASWWKWRLLLVFCLWWRRCWWRGISYRCSCLRWLLWEFWSWVQHFCSIWLLMWSFWRGVSWSWGRWALVFGRIFVAE